MNAVKITTADALNALEAIHMLQQGITRVVGGEQVHEPPLKLPGETGLKLRRLKRELKTIAEDYQEERNNLLKRHAELDEKGEVVSIGSGKSRAAKFPTPEAEAAFLEEQERLQEAEVEISDSLCLRDLRRKERDASGKVYETDDIEGFLIDLLGPLMREEMEEAAA